MLGNLLLLLVADLLLELLGPLLSKTGLLLPLLPLGFFHLVLSLELFERLGFRLNTQLVLLSIR